MELSRRHHRIPEIATTTIDPPKMSQKMLLLRFTGALYRPLEAVNPPQFPEAIAETCHS